MTRGRSQLRCPRAASVAALALLAATGCGSPSLSVSQLRQRASALCSQADRDLGRIAGPASPSGGTTFLDQGIAALEPEVADLRSLTPPAGEAPVYQSALRAQSGELDALRAGAAALRRGDDPVRTFRSVQAQLAPLEIQADDAWHALGIEACVSRH